VIDDLAREALCAIRIGPARPLASSPHLAVGKITVGHTLKAGRAIGGHFTQRSIVGEPSRPSRCLPGAQAQNYGSHDALGHGKCRSRTSPKLHKFIVGQPPARPGTRPSSSLLGACHRCHTTRSMSSSSPRWPLGPAETTLIRSGMIATRRGGPMDHCEAREECNSGHGTRAAPSPERTRASARDTSKRLTCVPEVSQIHAGEPLPLSTFGHTGREHQPERRQPSVGYWHPHFAIA
jgi:hypothetical protein